MWIATQFLRLYSSKLRTTSRFRRVKPGAVICSETALIRRVRGESKTHSRAVQTRGEAVVQFFDTLQADEWLDEGRLPLRKAPQSQPS